MNAVRLSLRSALVLGLASIVGLMMLGWPLLLQVTPGERVDPALCLPGPELIRRVILPAAQALAHLEKRGITHRAIRPDNTEQLAVTYIKAQLIHSHGIAEPARQFMDDYGAVSHGWCSL